MDRRLELSEKLHNVFDDKVEKIYFQKPENNKLVYDCIIYNFDGYENVVANDQLYLLRERYSVMHIHREAKDGLGKFFLDKKNFLFASHDRSFIADNLYHDVYVIYM